MKKWLGDITRTVLTFALAVAVIYIVVRGYQAQNLADAAQHESLVKTEQNNALISHNSELTQQVKDLTAYVRLLAIRAAAENKWLATHGVLIPAEFLSVPPPPASLGSSTSGGTGKAASPSKSPSTGASTSAKTHGKGHSKKAHKPKK
ncbi:MAG: hypothetical protein ACM3UO_00335 [Bacillota bacterium]